MTGKNYIVADFGASGGRVVAARFDGERIHFDETHRFENTPVTVSGTLYWDILRLYSELKIGMRKSYEKYKEITSIGIDTFGVDMGFIDKSRRLLANPVSYRDQKRASFNGKPFKKIPEREFFEISGFRPCPIISVFHLYSLKTDDAPEYLNAYKCLMMPDLLNFFLTGEIFSEYTNATTTGLCDCVKDNWDENVFEKLELDRALMPDIIRPGTQVGVVQKSLRDELEMPPIPVVAPATHDTASAVTGTPFDDKNENRAFISMGTWCVTGVEVSEPVITDAVYKSGYGNLGCVEGRMYLSKALTGLWIIQQCRAKWMEESGRKIEWDEIVSSTKKNPMFKSFIDVDDPVFASHKTDMPVAIVQYCQGKNQVAPETKGEIAHCVYESLAMKFRSNLKELEKVGGKKIEVLHLVGGGIKNALLCQWTADATGIPVVAGPAEATVAGNLLMQLKGTGEIKSVQEGRAIIRNSFELETYEPTGKEQWNKAYDKYLKTT